MPVLCVLRPIEAQRDEEEAPPWVCRRWWGGTRKAFAAAALGPGQRGLGQVVLVSGEAGIGKSALVRALRHHIGREGVARITYRCSPYHTHSAFYPIIGHLERLLQFERDEDPATRLSKLERLFQTYTLPLEEVVPLFAALLSVPLPEDAYPALALTPQQQRQHTHDALLAWLWKKPNGARAGGLGRPALGRSLHARAPRPLRRPDPDEPDPGGVDLPSGVCAALAATLAYDVAHLEPPRAAPD